MKHLTLLVLAATLSILTPAYAGGTLKEVCHDKVDKAGKPVMDKKTGKQAQECKKIKFHKKLEVADQPAKK